MYHRGRVRIAAALLAVCVMAAAFPEAALAAGGQTRAVHSIANSKNLAETVANANDGDIVEISGSCMTNDTNSNAPWVIDKKITIRGVSKDASINLRAGGIILAADVTFENLELAFPNAVRNAIMANGHTLTLRNIVPSTSTKNAVHLFCGGATGLTLDAPSGNHGNIIIENCPEIGNGNGNVYAGSISTDGQPNVSSIPATVTMIGTSKMGEFYACGALETLVDNDHWFDTEYTPAPPDPSVERFPVTGDVTFNLYYTSTSMVDGATGGDKNAAVVYTGKGYPNSGLTLNNLSSLTVGSGEKLTPTTGSSLDGAELIVPAASVLDLTNLTNLVFAGLQGGGDLILGQKQTLTIDSSVSGTTRIGIGGIFNGASQQDPVLGHVYVRAPQSVDGDFELLCPSSKPNLKLVRDNNGSWTVEDDSPGGEEKPPSKLVSLDPRNVHLTSEESEGSKINGISIPLNTVYSGDELSIDTIPLTIRVKDNGETIVTPDEDYGYRYETNDLRIFTGDEGRGNGEEMWVYAKLSNGSDPAAVPDGVYQFDITVPGNYTSSGMDLSASCTLTIGDNVTPPPTSISVPVAKTGLKWTGAEQTGVEEGAGYTLTGHKGTAVGSYTAVAALKSGYVWSDGTTTSKDIPWSIAKADGPAAPIGLSAVPPTSAGGSDGKILGVTAAMEYATRADFSDAKNCTSTEITNLTPGAYFVRLYGTQTHEAGTPASITVPDFNAPTVVSIRVNSTGHKTSYELNSPLDVTGLTIEAVYSDHSTQTVPVTEYMVSGFDSSTAGSKTLTVTYEGRQTTYIVEVKAAEQPGHVHSWSTAWYNDSGYHWRECRTENCPITENREKEDYADHTIGDWITDQAATSSQAGSRHRECTACGYVTAQETIPATGSSSSGGSYSGNVTSNTQRNPDGSTTTTRTNRTTGAVTTTTKWPDGSQTVVETGKDGVVTTTEKATDGSTTKTVQNPDGSSRTIVNRADSVAAETNVDRWGRAEALVKLPAQVTQEAQRGDKAVLLPVPKLPATGEGSIFITVQTSSRQPVKVEVPVDQPGPGTVAVIVHPNGVEEIVKTSVVTQQGVLLKASDRAVVMIKDNSKHFSDVNSHWAKDAIGFVSARELFQGEGPSAFAPDGGMSRAMLMTVLARLDVANTAGGGTWYAGGMDWAVAHGVSDGSNPDGIITREQLVSMLYRYAGSPPVGGEALSFTDAQTVSSYAQASMHWAVENEILHGYEDGSLAPGGSATRAEVAAVLTRYVELLNRTV